MHRYNSKIRRRGSIAMLFIPIMIVILGLVVVIVHVGQISLQRVMTSNAADAACLAGASWIASGINECTWIHRKAETTRNMAMGMFLVPVCPNAGSNEQPYNTNVETFWNRLMSPGNTGPFTYFSTVCEGVIEEGWRMGAVGAYTGFVNNLVVKGGYTEGANFWPTQHELYQNPLSAPEVNVEWQSGGITQVAEAGITYPGLPQVSFSAVPSAPLDSWGYLSYRHDPLDWNWYECDDNPAIDNGTANGNVLWGLSNPYSGTVNIHDGAGGRLTTTPLRMVNNQVKQYEYAMGFWQGISSSGYRPGKSLYSQRSCSNTCGALLVSLPNGRTSPNLQRWVSGVAVAPISVASSHEYGTEVEQGEDPPYLVPRGETITSSCTATVGTVPNFSPAWAGGGGWPYWFRNSLEPGLTGN